MQQTRSEDDKIAFAPEDLPLCARRPALGTSPPEHRIAPQLDVAVPMKPVAARIHVELSILLGERRKADDAVILFLFRVYLHPTRVGLVLPERPARPSYSVAGGLLSNRNASSAGCAIVCTLSSVALISTTSSAAFICASSSPAIWGDASSGVAFDINAGPSSSPLYGASHFFTIPRTCFIVHSLRVACLSFILYAPTAWASALAARVQHTGRHWRSFRGGGRSADELEPALRSGVHERNRNRTISHIRVTEWC